MLKSMPTRLLLFKLNDLRLDSFVHFFDFVSQLTNEHRNAIKTVRIEVQDILDSFDHIRDYWNTGGWSRRLYECVFPMERLGGLKYLVVDVDEDTHDLWRPNALLSPLRGFIRQCGGKADLKIVFGVCENEGRKVCTLSLDTVSLHVPTMPLRAIGLLLDDTQITD
jgi:hypothetical protein